MRIQGKTNITAGVAPFDSADTFETHSALYGKGGWRTVNTIAERDAIPVQRREELMVVTVIADGKAYQLVGGIANDNWQSFSAGGGGGKVMVFVLPGNIKPGVQRVVLGFPYAGSISDITATVIDAGLTDTQLQLQKISCDDYLAGLEENWVDVLETPLLIEEGNKSSLNSVNNIVFLDSVDARDYFRINILAAGDSANDMTIEVTVDLS